MSRLGHRLAAYLLAGVTCLLASAPTLAFDVAGDQYGDEDVAGTIERGGWHAPGAATQSDSLDRAPRPGDLFLGQVRDAAGELHAVRAVVR